MGLCNFSARTRGFLQGERPAWLERSGWRTAPTSLARGGESAVNPGSASGPGAPGQRAVGVTRGRAGRGAAQELLTPADTHSHHQRLSGTPGPTGTQRPVRVVPHLSLHVVPGLLQIVPGAVRVVVNELGHDAAHLLLQLQRREHEPRSAYSKPTTPSLVTRA